MLISSHKGLAFVLVENPLALQDQHIHIPDEMQKNCAAQNISLQGNAAGNWEDYTDLTGQILVAPLEER
jgi:iron transport multicopper oxidase